MTISPRTPRAEPPAADAERSLAAEQAEAPVVLGSNPPTSGRVEGAPEREWVDYTSEMTITKYRPLRAVFIATGIGAIGMGVLGYLLPGLPGTVFFLIAAWFFAQSSPRFYNWLMNHRIFGKMIRDYRAGKGIPRWVKFYAPFMIVTFSGFSAYYVGIRKELPWIGVSILVIAAYGVWYVLRVPVSDPNEP